MKSINFLKHAAAALIIVALALTGCKKNDPDEKTTYTVTFDAAGGTPAPSAQSVEEGGTATQPADPAKDGYVFLYWHLKDAAAAYSFNTPVTADITLTAKWLEDDGTIEYWNISWNLNGGAWPGDVTPASKVVKGKTLAEPNAPVKEGGTFEGWYKEAALTGKITFPHTVTADIALYAKWTGESGGEAPGTFTSIAALKAWLENQPDNTAETPYKVALKGVNLDADNGWNELGVAVKGKKIVELDLSGCTGTAIPDGSVSFQGTTMTTKGAFVGCGNLVAVTLPESLKTIGDYVFFSCANLASVTFPQGLTAINRYAFSYCTNLASVALPGGLRKIGASAFAESGLASISIPNSVDEWTYAFTKCTSLTSVVLEEGIESVPQEAFWQCSLLTSVNLPSSIKTIGDNAFFRCGLESITIPQGVTSIGESAFEGCKLKELVLPEGLISIGEGAFRVNRQLLAVSLPAGLKTIGAEAFRTCDALVSLSIPEGIQSIGKGAFSHCEALVNLSLPDGLKVLTANSFEWCTSLKSVTVPASVTSIENYVFSNCKALEELVMLPVTPPAFISTALTSTSAFQRIKVPAASVTAYKAKVGWMAYKDKIVANE